MISCSSSSHGLYACILIVKNGKPYFYERKERWQSKYTRSHQEAGFLDRATRVIVALAEQDGLTLSDIQEAGKYPERGPRRLPDSRDAKGRKV